MAEEKTKIEEVKEVRIKKVETLSQAAQNEVRDKLSAKDDNFNYKGYAKVSYIETSPLSVYSIDPIEGTIIDVFNNLQIE